MKERIEELMKSEGLTSVKLAELLSVQPSNISHIMSGRNNPSYDLIVKLLDRFPNVNPEWILLGKGDMYKCNNDNSRESTLDKLVTNVTTSGDTPFTNHVNSDIPLESHIYDTLVPKISLHDGTHSQVDQTTLGVQQPKSVEQIDNSSIINSLQLSEMISGSKKQVKKIVLLYDDNSFEIFHNT